MKELTQSTRKKNWICIYPGCKEPVKNHYNCYSHVWDSHLRHISNSPLFSSDEKIFKKLNDKTEAKKQCEMYMVEINPDADVEQQRAIAIARFGKPLEDISSNHSFSNELFQNDLTTLNQSSNSEQIMWDYLENNTPEEQLKNVLQHDDFIRIIQISKNLKRLYVAGEILAENGFLQRSDERVKEHIKPLKGCLDTVLELTGKSFSYIGKEEQKFGFIAQEVEKICPELVQKDDIGLSVDVVAIIPILVEALKEIHDATSETKNDYNDKFKMLSDAIISALNTAENVQDKINEYQSEKIFNYKEEKYHFSFGPAVLTLVGGVFFFVLSLYTVIQFQLLPGIWIYCMLMTIVMWINCYKLRNELVQSINKRKLILYWHRENSLSLYFALFIGVMIYGIAFVMGTTIIALTSACVTILLVFGGFYFMSNKMYKISFSIIFTILVAFFICVCIVIGILSTIQPDYTCSFINHPTPFVLKVDLNELSPKQFITQVPWNCWSRKLEFSDDLPDGFYGISNTRNPYIEGTAKQNFPTTAINVYMTCVDSVKFYCGTITFQTCSSRSSEEDCIGNSCKWNSTTLCE